MRNSAPLLCALRCGLLTLAAALALLGSSPAEAQSAKPLVIKAGRITVEARHDVIERWRPA